MQSQQDGVPTTGVSVAYTVRAMDAGPVLRQVAVAVQPNETAPELLTRLFALGTATLLECLPSVWDGSAPGLAVPQDPLLATHAAKVIAILMSHVSCHSRVIINTCSWTRQRGCWTLIILRSSAMTRHACEVHGCAFTT